MTYPICLLVISFLITLFLLFAIVPTFQELYTDLNLKLPLITKSLLNVGQYFKAKGICFMLGFLSFTVSYILFYRSFPSLHHHLKINIIQCLHASCSKLPLIRHLYKISLMARFSNSLFIMQAAGMPIIQALASLSKTFQNHFFSKILHTIILFLQQGIPLIKPCNDPIIFPQ